MNLFPRPFRKKQAELPIAQQAAATGPVFMSDKVHEWRNELRTIEPFETGIRDAALQRPESFGRLRIKQAFENQLDHVMDKVEEYKALLQSHVDHLDQPDAMAVRDINRMMEVLERFLATCNQQKDLAANLQGWLADQLDIYNIGYKQGSNDFAA
ncbi:MAG: hypothetical protein LAT76_12705 [Schleiferiaceae bacterium]|nr:hypothetical protein [Schleiferiaceae bacterium]